MLADGMARDEAELEAALRAVAALGDRARRSVPADLPVAVADRLRGAGVGDRGRRRAVEARRRAKTATELEGIRRAQRAAERGWPPAERLIQGADARATGCSTTTASR